jgi:hypothetical protein
VSRSAGLIALLLFAILSIVGVVAVTRPVLVASVDKIPPNVTAAAPAAADAGTLDSLLDAVHVEHVIKHGR